MVVVLNKRERLRAAAIVEIKKVARRQLAEGGPGAVSLRAVARDMGMTAPALYRYFPSVGSLLAALTADIYDEARAVLVAARDGLASVGPLERLGAVSRAFREWAISSPTEFSLVFGSPVPALAAAGVEPSADPDHRACGEAGTRFGQVFAALLAEQWAVVGFPVPDPARIHPDLSAQLSRLAEHLGGAMSVEAVYVYVSCWTRLYGMVVMEAYGHQKWALEDVRPMFESELADVLARLEPTA